MTANYNMKDNINFVIKHGDGDSAVYLNPVLAIYGSNAGGKTNMLQALLDAVKNISEKSIYNVPFMYHANDTFLHRLVVVQNNIEYEYEYTANVRPSISMDDFEILKESLLKRDLRARGEEKIVFVREGENITNSIYKDNQYKNNEYDFLKMIALNKSILVMRHAGELGWDDFRPLYQWCSNVMAEMYTQGEEDRQKNLKRYATTLHSDKESLLKFSTFMTSFDPALNEITTFTQESSDKTEKVDTKTQEKAYFAIWHKYRKANGKLSPGRVHTTQKNNDRGEKKKEKKNDVELVITGENGSKCF
jgi:AAA15 family ATPase/GTPase